MKAVCLAVGYEFDRQIDQWIIDLDHPDLTSDFVDEVKKAVKDGLGGCDGNLWELNQDAIDNAAVKLPAQIEGSAIFYVGD